MTIPRRILGKTGVEVTALGLGGVCWNLADSDGAAVEVVHHGVRKVRQRRRLPLRSTRMPPGPVP